MAAVAPTRDKNARPTIARMLSASADPIAAGLDSIYITVAGNITIVNEDDTTTGSIAVAVGHIPIAPYKITAKTATIMGLFQY